MNLLPSSPQAKKVCDLFHRKHTTCWSGKEIRAFRKLNSFFASVDDWNTICRYYYAERKKGDKGMHRRDLQTFLNNAISELDRARAYALQHPVERNKPSHHNSDNGHVELTDEQIAKNKAFIAPLIEQLRNKLKPNYQ